jgi:hypothetical protein
VKLPVIALIFISQFSHYQLSGNFSSDPLPLSGADSTIFLKTGSGKTIIVRESHPDGLSTSKIDIIPQDFKVNTPIELEKSDPLLRIELTDLDNDGFQELFIFTQSAGSGSSGMVYGFASDKDERLVKIEFPQNTDEEYQNGGQLEGYMGHDIYHFEDNMLVREFPVYKSTDTNITPTGGKKEVYYKYHDFKLIQSKVKKTE